MTVRGAEGPTESRRPAHMVPRTTGQVLTQPIFDWKAQDNYNKLSNFKIEVRNIFMAKFYIIEESEKVLIIMSWLGHEGLSLSKH